MSFSSRIAHLLSFLASTLKTESAYICLKIDRFSLIAEEENKLPSADRLIHILARILHRSESRKNKNKSLRSLY